MINWVHSRLHRPERGWDPVPPHHVADYAAIQWQQGVREELIRELEIWTGGLKGRTVLDLGGGPGHYSIAFAMLGARVTWFDVSKRYMDVVRARAADIGISLDFGLGYMDEAPSLLKRTFDLVFNRVCWNYGRGDRSFSSVIWALLAPGGVAYIDTTHDEFRYDQLSPVQRLQVRMNRTFGFKVGHPFPPRGRIGRLFTRFPTQRLQIDNTLFTNDRVLIKKPDGDS